MAPSAGVPRPEVAVIGYTIGVGPIYEEMAMRSADRMQAMTGVRCIILGAKECDGLAHPSWAKLGIWDYVDEEEVLYFDADVFCLRPWDPAGLARVHRGFSAVPEYTSEVIEEALAIGLRRAYCNCGLFLATREECKLAFEVASRRHPEWHRWLEQSALNHALQDHGAPIHCLPPEFNVIVPPGSTITPEVMLLSDAVNVHLAGCPGYPEARLEWQTRLLMAHERPDAVPELHPTSNPLAIQVLRVK